MTLLQQIWLQNHWVCYWCFKIPQCGYMEHGLKHVTLYVQNMLAALAMCSTPVIVRDKPLGAPASVKLVDWYMRVNMCYWHICIRYLDRWGLTHWGRVTHINVSKLTSIGSDNGLSPGRRQAIIWTNTWISLILYLGTNFSEILIEILTFSFMKICLKVSPAKWRPFCIGLNVLNSDV